MIIIVDYSIIGFHDYEDKGLKNAIYQKLEEKKKERRKIERKRNRGRKKTAKLF